MDEKKKVVDWNTIMTSTPSMSGSRIEELYKQNVDQDWFKNEYLGGFDSRPGAFLDASVLSKGTISTSSAATTKAGPSASEIIASMKAVSEATKGSTFAASRLGEALGRFGAVEPDRKTTITAEDLKKLVESTAPAPKPADLELRGTARIAAAMRAEKEAKLRAKEAEVKGFSHDFAILDEAHKEHERKSERQQERGPEWGSW